MNIQSTQALCPRTFFRIKNRLITALISVFCVLSISMSASAANGSDQFGSVLAPLVEKIKHSPKSSVMVEASADRAAFALRENDALLPASTLKILTAYLAIQRWGLDHRFVTDFYIDRHTLWIKGYGDPYLVSEELILIQVALQPYLEKQQITRIGVDTSAFPDVDLGRGDSDNPYDAGNAALALNFNSINLVRHQDQVVSAESQTPITSLAQQIGNEMGIGAKAKRVSLPGGRDMSARYFAEVFSAQVFNTELPIIIGQVPVTAPLVYQHANSKNLEQVLVAMLKYSNNFIANQLFLMMGTDPSQPQITASQLVTNAHQYVMETSKQAFGWDHYEVVDGAGLSRNNYLSAQQMMVLLDAFRPWRYLLPERNSHVQAKTGTLTGVRTYAGYYRDSADQWKTFVLMMNEQIAWRFRYAFADALRE